MPATDLDAILATAAHDRKRLDSQALGAFSLTLLGVASVVGAGIFVVAGDARRPLCRPGGADLLRPRRDSRRPHRRLVVWVVTLILTIVGLVRFAAGNRLAAYSWLARALLISVQLMAAQERRRGEPR